MYLTSCLPATEPPQNTQTAVTSMLKPSPTGFVTSIATQTVRGGQKVVSMNDREDL